jgi:His-Xaa-Ser system protein HxsD
MDPKVDRKSNSVLVMLDENVFPRQVGLAAAYHFLERCYVQLERRPAHRLHVRLKGKEPLDPAALCSLGEEFGNELVHQLVRHQVSERTDRLREAIVGRALMSAEPAGARECAPQADPLDALDYLEDPLGIAVPWEEKHGQKRKPGKSRKK